MNATITIKNGNISIKYLGKSFYDTRNICEADQKLQGVIDGAISALNIATDRYHELIDINQNNPSQVRFNTSSAPATLHIPIEDCDPLCHLRNALKKNSILSLAGLRRAIASGAKLKGIGPKKFNLIMEVLSEIDAAKASTPNKALSRINWLPDLVAMPPPRSDNVNPLDFLRNEFGATSLHDLLEMEACGIYIYWDSIRTTCETILALEVKSDEKPYFSIDEMGKLCKEVLKEDPSIIAAFIFSVMSGLSSLEVSHMHSSEAGDYLSGAKKTNDTCKKALRSLNCKDEYYFFYSVASVDNPRKYIEKWANGAAIKGPFAKNILRNTWYYHAVKNGEPQSLEECLHELTEALPGDGKMENATGPATPSRIADDPLKRAIELWHSQYNPQLAVR